MYGESFVYFCALIRNPTTRYAEEFGNRRKPCQGQEAESQKNKVIWVLAIIGAVAAVAGIAYAVYRFFTPDYLEEFEDDFDDDFDDYFSEDDQV